MTLVEQMGAGTGTENLYVSDDAPRYEGEELVVYDSFKNLMKLFFPGSKDDRRLTVADLLELLIERLRAKLTGTPFTTRGAKLISFSEYAEEETSAFYSAGRVVTGDGRTIDFDIEAVMTRSFVEHTDIKIDYGAQMLVDPLVIALSDSGIDVSDREFTFDIDADGEMDNISLLGQMCGFLALDRNGDGVINDGSELFGTKSGDGFRDLRVFDMDGNGWIDENDEVFNRLKVWTKDESGKDRLLALGVAGVGAIYLGNVANEFSFKSQAEHETLAQIKKSGLYLTEEGKARQMAHVDFALS
ncbi:MAG: hypothetical protein ILP10_03345 [Lachnospiraceae bacterium]|nr:hypothetical protein [Lachnospiraceae bacterium]